jgi:hypothetical protein
MTGAPLDRGKPRLRLVVATESEVTPVVDHPGGVTGWDRRFLVSLARWPLPWLPAHIATLEWIARRARASVR